MNTQMSMIKTDFVLIFEDSNQNRFYIIYTIQYIIFRKNGFLVTKFKWYTEYRYIVNRNRAVNCLAVSVWKAVSVSQR